ncbi:DUF4241 domain-containing protein [Lentzea alba]|uniref:DUF4241 domain-containing protein n=1 Tax=Lentzea alba TaxID=2714351 RepID=UPI0039BF20BB
MTNSLGVVYCEGWDPERRVISGRLPVAVARERDRTGEQYAFCLVDVDRVVRVCEIAWAARFARTWHLDEHGRRTKKSEYRVLDGRLFLLRSHEWTYPDAEQPEFDEKVSGSLEIRNSPDGTSRRHEAPQGYAGYSTERTLKVDATSFFRDVPQFSDWAAFAEIDADLVEQDEVHQPAEPPWRPAVPMRPDGMDSAFRPGLRWQLPDTTAVVEVVEAGTVRLPTGRLVASDPAWLDADLAPFTTTLPPGDYRVELSVLRFDDHPNHERVAAAKLIVSPDTVVSWELALEPGQDTLLLGDDQFYGFGVDAGMGCFVDAAACGALEEMISEAMDENRDLLEAVAETHSTVLTEPTSGTTLVAYSSGWGDGSYPTWIGRTASGEVACFVSDMLILRYGTALDQEVVH